MQAVSCSPGSERDVVHRVLDDISFSAPDTSGATVTIDAEYVRKNVGDLAQDTDLSKFIL